MIQRNRYINKIKPFINIDIIKVITGVRRCGKTILLSQIRDLLIKDYGINRENVIEINFESTKFDDLRNENHLYDYVCHIAEKRNEKVYIFIDEIQEVNNWQKVVNSFKVDFDCDIYNRLKFKTFIW